LLSLDNPMAIIESAFEQNANEKLECINEKCLKEFADAKSYLAHARRCGIMRRHSASSRADSPENLKKRNSSAKRETPKYYSNYAEYRGRASCWAVLPTLSKMKLIKNELDENPTKRL
uniref:C2H2-type domain-containing protein n=1 Tax=Anisakis simplex TaxID=6269 RepID=A0A0M3JLB7_ANISI